MAPPADPLNYQPPGQPHHDPDRGLDVFGQPVAFTVGSLAALTAVMALLTSMDWIGRVDGGAAALTTCFCCASTAVLAVVFAIGSKAGRKYSPYGHSQAYKAWAATLFGALANGCVAGLPWPDAEDLQLLRWLLFWIIVPAACGGFAGRFLGRDR